jgi:predicted TIM-barrel fold metal-dependent hydrolase
MTPDGINVVDAHVHLLPGRLGDKVRAFFDAGVASRTPLAYPNDHPVVVDTLAGEGVDALWSLPYAHKPGISYGLNEASMATAAQFAHSPVSVIGGLTVHPGDDDPVHIVTDAVDIFGLRVLKLHCSVGDFSLEDPRLDPVFAFAAERRLPVVVHLGHNVNGRTEAEELPAIGRVADKHPDMPLILAHCGHHAAQEALELMEEHASLYADLTPVVTEHPEITATQLISLGSRILFGSDAPNTTLSVTQCIEWLRAFDLPRHVLAGILGENAFSLSDGVVSYGN